MFGAVAGWLGTPATLMIGGGVCLFAAAAFATKLPSLRHASRSFDDDNDRATSEIRERQINRAPH